MRTAKLAVTCVLIACVAVLVTAATRAAPRKPTYDNCQALAMSRGIATGERLSSEHGPSAYEQFMTACLAGKVEGTRAQVAESWANCVKRRMGVEASEARSSDAWQKVMIGCLAAGAR
jgi:hypothetical protein